MVGANVNGQAIAGVAHALNLGLLTNTNAVAGYVLNDNSPGGASLNAVALYGWGKSNVTGAWTWGGNTITLSKLGIATNHQISFEADVNALNTSDVVEGIQISGGSTAIPASSVGIVLTPVGPGIPWGAGYFTQGGAASIGIELGPLAAAGTSINSQPVYLNFLDAGGLTQSYITQATPGSLSFFSTATAPAFQLNGDVIVVGTHSLLVGADVVLNNSSHALVLGSATAITSLTIGNGQPATKVAINGNAFVPSVVITASLSACATGADVGKMYVVSDATGPTYGGTLVGGGGVYALVVCNGSAWKTL